MRLILREYEDKKVSQLSLNFLTNDTIDEQPNQELEHYE